MLVLSAALFTTEVGSSKGDNGPSWQKASFPH